MSNEQPTSDNSDSAGEEPTQPFNVNENTVDDPDPKTEEDVDDAVDAHSRKDHPMRADQPFGVNDNTVGDSD